MRKLNGITALFACYNLALIRGGAIVRIFLGILLLVCSGSLYANDDDLHIGFILKSHHFDEKIFKGSPCETHNGIYLKYHGWSAGEYDNSFCKRSDFVGYESKKNDSGWSTAFMLANGYDQHKNNINGWLAIPSVGYQYSALKLRVSPKALFAVLEFNINPL